MNVVLFLQHFLIIAAPSSVFHLVQHLMTQDPAPKEIIELIGSRCKTGCAPGK